MPRKNRQEVALNHPNPVVGCIMALQERIKILGRSIVGCECPKHESMVSSLQEKVTGVESELSSLQEKASCAENELSSAKQELSTLRAELSSLQEKYNSMTANNTRLREHIKQNDAQYRDRIRALNLANASRTVLEICRDKAYREEILYLRAQVSEFQAVLRENNLPKSRISNPPYPWKYCTISKTAAWSVNPAWSEQNPGWPSDNPNDKDSIYRP